MAEQSLADGVDNSNSKSRTSPVNGHSEVTETTTNGHAPEDVDTTRPRADELESLLDSVLSQLIPFVRRADAEREAHREGRPPTPSSLVESHSPADLRDILAKDGTLSPFADRGSGP